MRKLFTGWRRAIAGVLALGSVSAILWGFVTNRVEDAYKLLLNYVSLWSSWTIVAVLVITCLAITCVILISFGFYILRGARLANAERDQQMIALDDPLLRELATWVPTTSQTQHETQFKAILKSILIKVIALFGDEDEGRAAILLPDDPTVPSFLKCCEQVEMSPESIADMQFYIGPDQQRQRSEGGVAGESYHSGKILVGHMDNLNGNDICKDQRLYRRFREERAYTPYKSFVCVPIRGLTTGASSVKSLGVLCIDSKKEDAFDSKGIEPTLEMLARRIAAAILICEKFH